MLIRISLIVAIIAGLAVGALNFTMVKGKVTTLQANLKTETEGRATAENSRKQRAVIDAILAKGVSSAEIGTSSFSVQPETQYDPQRQSPPKTTGYLVSNVVTEDYVTYAELGGVSHRRILTSYVMRNALVPQVTGLAMSLGTIFNGAVITEQIFGYPGIGALLVSAVYAGDYGLVLGVTTMSIIGVSTAVLLIDLVYPLLDPRVEAR